MMALFQKFNPEVKMMRKKSTFGFLFDMSRGVRGTFLAVILFSVLNIVFAFLMPQIVSFTVDSIIGSEAPSDSGLIAVIADAFGGRDTLRANLLLICTGVIFCAAAANFFSCLAKDSIARATQGLVRNLRNSLFVHIQHLPFSWHSANSTGDIIQRCTYDTDVVREFIYSQLIEVVRTVLLVAAAMVLMFRMNVRLACVCLATIPVIILYSLLFYRRISRQFLLADEAEGEVMTDVQENLTGVRVVRAFGRERYEKQKFEKCLDVFTNKWVDLGYTLGFFWGIGDFATAAQLLAVICVGAYLGAVGELSLGNFLAFVTYTQSIAWPVRSLGRTLSEMSKAGVSVRRLQEILDAPAEENPPDALKPDLNGDIVFDRVSFAYAGTPVLKDLSFTVRRGSTFGILGGTGSGKSTITYLLNRLYALAPENGRITISGVDIRRMDLTWLRTHVGLVLQEPFLFSKTIRENIDIVNGNSPMEDIRAAARAAKVEDDILSFPKGYDTVVGERGVTLSGGQKQRIAIARALLSGAPVLVFDDSMSAVDMETDAAIRASLLENTGGQTVILISHRISTLMTADRILVLEDGHAADIGTHEELIARDGLYRRVYLTQTDAGSQQNGGDSFAQ